MTEDWDPPVEIAPDGCARFRLSTREARATAGSHAAAECGSVMRLQAESPMAEGLINPQKGGDRENPGTLYAPFELAGA